MAGRQRALAGAHCRQPRRTTRKRGEDVRARLNVLSEMPGAWKTAVDDVARAEPALQDRRERHAGARTATRSTSSTRRWSARGRSMPIATRSWRRFASGSSRYMTKALREAKVHTSWLSPDDAYEQAVTRFVEAILDRRRSSRFLQSFARVRSRASRSSASTTASRSC